MANNERHQELNETKEDYEGSFSTTKIVGNHDIPAIADNERHQELNDTMEDYEGRSNLWNFYHRWMAPTEEDSEAELMEVEISQDSHVNHNLQEAMTENERNQELNDAMEDYEGRSNLWNFYHF